MSDLNCTSSTLKNGVWYGVFSGLKTPPDLEIRHLDMVLSDVEVTEDAENWCVSVPIPSEAISDGVHRFAVFDKTDENVVADFTLIAGDLASHDIRAELELLRAELDMLKRAFRRHCVETA